MNTFAKLGAFVLALGVTFGGAYGVGTLAGPAATTASSHDTADGGEVHGDTGDHAAEGGAQAASGPGGLAVSADGYTLRQVGPGPNPGAQGEYAFQIVDATGAALTRFQISHEKQLHMIVVRRDLTGFQHLHPQMSPDGIWRTPLTLAQAGDWRVFTDFLPEGRTSQVILGIDVPVTGDYRPQPLPQPASEVDVDGYTVTATGGLAAGRTSRLTLTVAKDGVPVTDLQPYLGAYGHLVALRAGDAGYLHVHPLQTDRAGPAITFDVEVPATGAYRLFLDFQHGGVVRTAQLTAVAS